MSTKHMALAWEISGIKGSDYVVLLALCHAADSDGMVRDIRTKDISAMANVSWRHAMRSISKLTSDGLIHTIPRPGSCSQYLLNMDENNSPESSQGHDADVIPTPDTGVIPGYDADVIPNADKDKGGYDAGVIPTPDTGVIPKDVEVTEDNSLRDKGVKPCEKEPEKSENPISTVYTSIIQGRYKEDNSIKHIRLKFEIGSWQRRFAMAFWQRLEDAGCLSRTLGRKTGEAKEKEIQRWADEIDKIHRLDGYTEDEIQAVAKWLFSGSNWWVETGNFRTVRKLRRSDRTGEKYFEVMFAQMRGHGATLDVDLSQTITDRQMKQVCQVHGFGKDDFWKKGKDKQGDWFWLLRPEKLEAVHA